MRNGITIRALGWAGLLSLSAGAAEAQAAAAVDAGNPAIAADSVVYELGPGSRLDVKTGKAGVFGFVGHNHLIESRAVHGAVVYYPREPARSHLEVTVDADSLQVLTPRDTAEQRKVGETMRSEVLKTADYPVIRLVSKEVQPKGDGFHVVGEMTLVGQTRSIPLDVVTQIGSDTLEARSTFSFEQSEFGITPYRGGPGGTVKVADRVVIDFTAVGVRAEGASLMLRSPASPTEEAVGTGRR